MSSNATISKQSGRRYRQFRSTASLGARPFSSTGAAVAATLIYGPLSMAAACVYQRGIVAADVYQRGIVAAQGGTN